MANPTSIAGIPAVLVASTSEQSVMLETNREYTLAHDGENASGVADTATIYLAFQSASVDADASEGASKFKLLGGRSVVLGPGLDTVKFKVAAGAPTFSVSPGPEISPLSR